MLNKVQYVIWVYLKFVFPFSFHVFLKERFQCSFSRHFLFGSRFFVLKIIDVLLKFTIFWAYNFICLNQSKFIVVKSAATVIKSADFQAYRVV